MLYGKVCIDLWYLGRNPKSANSSRSTESFYTCRVIYDFTCYVIYLIIYVCYFYKKKHPGKYALDSWYGFEKTLLGTTAKIYFFGTLFQELAVYFYCVRPAMERSIYQEFNTYWKKGEKASSHKEEEEKKFM